MMRILYVATAAEFGGVSRHILWVAEHLISQGHEVGFVIAPEPRLMAQARKLGVEVFTNPYFVRAVQLYNDIRALRPVFKAIKRFKPDLVSAHSTKAGYAARLVCALTRTPVIFTAHGWAFTEGREMWKRQLLALAERVAAKVTRKIICVSEHDRELALKFRVGRPEQIVMVHNGVDPKPLLNADGAVVQQEFGLEEGPVLTMVGRLAPPKDPLTVLEATLLTDTAFKLLFIGGGVQYDAVQEFISENRLQRKVILTGEREDIPEILAVSDLFILSSRWEGLPRSIIEAMMAGLPVVATSVGGVPELVEDGVTGFLVPREDPEALAEAIRKLLADEDLRQRMGQAGREKALREFSLDRMLAQTQEVYEEILEVRASRHS